MEHFLQQLQTIPEVAELIRRVDDGGCPAAVTGLQPVQRACVGAAVSRATGRPAVFVCGDDREARQLTADLTALTGRAPVLLLSREWQFRPGAVSSRDWERSRLAALYALANGDAPVTVATADALMARTLPPELLTSLSMTLEVGGQADLKQLTDRLLAAGYTRCDQVEGVGQFALRGGILDVFSPLMDQPVRCEFFDDEIDSMGTFDPTNQRRTANVTSALLLPAAEVLPRSADGGLEGLGETLLHLADKLAKKQKTESTVARLREDGERLKNGAVPGGMDRYLAAIYPEVTAGVHYLPGDAVVFLCESGRVDERVKSALLQNKQDTEALLEAGLLAGDYAKLLLSGEELYAALEDFPVIMADSLPTSRHPLKPRGLLAMNARQLSSYGGSLETAVTDLEHYRANGSAVLVLCAGESRAHNLHRLLEERGGPHLPGRFVSGLRVAVSEAGGADRRPAHRLHPEAAEAEKGVQPPENPVLHRPLPRRPGGPRPPRRGPVRGHPADAGGWRGKGLHQNRLRRGRLPVRPRHPAGLGEQVYRWRRGPGPPEAEQAGRHRVGQAKDPGEKGRQGPCQGLDSSVRRAAAPSRLRLLPRLPLAEGV